MKSIVGRVMTGDNTTEDGQKLDATFSYNGFIKRVVHSPELMGTLNSLLLRVGERVIAAYRGK